MISVGNVMVRQITRVLAVLGVSVLMCSGSPPLAGASGQSTWMGGPGCGGANEWRQHPVAFPYFCDGAAVVEGARWRNWGASTATARATFNAALLSSHNSVASAPRRRSAVTITASRIELCSGRRAYTSIKLRYAVPVGGVSTLTLPTLLSHCRPLGQGGTHNRPASTNPPEFYARPAGGYITCGIGGAGSEQLVRCQGAPAGTNPLENVATLQPGGQLETCSRHQTEVRCFEGNVGEGTPTLSAGAVDTQGPFACKVLETGVECTVTATGRGFLITPERVTEVGG
jgi:hypothetical protein